jgi:hypothetical protein
MNSSATVVFAPTRLVPVRFQISLASDRSALQRLAARAAVAGQLLKLMHRRRETGAQT